MDTIHSIQDRVNAQMRANYEFFIDYLKASQSSGLTLEQVIHSLEVIQSSYKNTCAMCESGYKCERHG